MTVTHLHPGDPDEPDPGADRTEVAEATPGVALVLADPRELVLEDNVRLDPRVDKPFLASIRDLGVLVPLVAYRTAEDQLRVLFGQRRTLAAVEVGMDQVPVFVVDVPDEEKAREIARIIGQVAENDDRTDLKGSERARAFQQLTMLGLSATQVARRTHRKVGEVRAGLTVAGSSAAAAALDAADLTLMQAAAIAEFDDDPAAVRRLSEVARQEPDAFDHAVQRLRDKRLADTLRTELTSNLTQAGVRLLDRSPYVDPTTARLDVLADGDGNELDADQHASCPGHAAYLRDNGSWDGKADITPVYVCTDWRKQGHRHRLGTPLIGVDETTGGGMSEEAKTERRVVIATNKAWGAAQTVRRQWLTSFLTRRSAPRDAPQWVAATLASCSYEIRRALEDSHGLALELLGLTREQTWSPYRGTAHPVAVAAQTASPARAGILTLGLVLGGLESTVMRDTWRRATTAHQAYFAALQDWGYTLSEVEQLVLGPDGDGPDDDPEGEPDSGEPISADDANADGASDSDAESTEKQGVA